ncbi:hypothetical protein ACO0LB_07005 [Undibacterium sp. SXout7W]|uniref:hypothetical protein n=1 Tax=Undibacterium sp. SXout7W TaxID=3413049 RepID=UPI003BF3DE5B
MSWYPFNINEDGVSGVADFSGMNRAITPADRLFVRNAHFYRVGNDGKANTKDDKRVRIFGISLSSAANFPKEEDAPKIAKRLRKMGFNAVRLHHLDTILSDSDEHPRGILTSAAFPSFNATALQRLRVLIGALKEEGLYVNLNLHVGYTFRPAVDQITPLIAGGQIPFASHPLHLFEPRMIALQVEYAQQLIRRLDLGNNPALAMIEINNESSMVGAWQRGDLDQLNGEYERLLQLQWQRWILHRYGSLEKACAEWNSCSMPKRGGVLVQSAESRVLEFGEGWIAGVQQYARRIMTKLDMSISSVLQQQFHPHQHGAGKRVLDYVQFLTETDKQYLEILRKAIRTEVGDLVPLTGTQMYFGGVVNSDAQQHMDYADEHFYVDHYDFPRQAWDRNDWRIRNHSALRQGWSSLLQRALYRDLNKPFVVSEFNQAYPNQQSAEIMPVLAAIASAQDWDGLFFFQYVDGDSWAALPDSFGLSGHWGQWVTTGISAAMFRQFHISPLSAQLPIGLTADTRQMLGALRDGVAGIGLPEYAANCTGVDIKQIFSYRTGFIHKNDMLNKPCRQAEADAANANSVWNASGNQLAYDSAGPWLKADTIYSRMFAGHRTDAGINSALPGLMPEFSRQTRQLATVLLTSRDGLPASTSKRLLLIVTGATVGTQPNESPQRPKRLQQYPSERAWWTLEPDTPNATKPSGARDAQAPVWLESIDMTFFHPSTAHRLQIFPLDGNGQRMQQVDPALIRKGVGGFIIHLHHSSPWFEMVIN